MRISVFEDRKTFLLKYVKGKDVLDVGPAELVGTTNRAKMERWPHNIIRGVAKSLYGIDNNVEQVIALREIGFDIVEGDAEDFDLGASYDVVFAGEVIEHLSNPGEFLRCAKMHLRHGGVVLITTPNRFSIKALKSVLLYNTLEEYRKPIDGHIAYYDIGSVRELLEREGFSIIEIGYCMWVGEQSRRWVLRKVLWMLSRVRPHVMPGIAVAARLASGELE